MSPTPLDVLFILTSSITILLFLLWVLQGAKYADPPHFLQAMVQSVWAKMSFAGGSAAMLVLRRFVESKPAPNYLIWIPSFLGMMIVALFLLGKVVPAQPMAAIRVAVAMSLDLPVDDPEHLRERYHLPDFNLWEELPDPGVDPHGVYFNPTTDTLFPYRDTLSVLEGHKSLAFIKLNPWIAHVKGSERKYDYAICLNRGKTWPAVVQAIKIALSCENGACAPAKAVDKGYVIPCDATAKNVFGWEQTVYADEVMNPAREKGWDVPSLATLQQMTDRERVGYTLFDVSFTPQGRISQAEKYYYALRVNGQPVYIGGLSPGVQKESLRPGAENHLQFGLENLSFTGQFAGYEKLDLRIYFVLGETVVYYQDLSRDYIALRDAAEIPPLVTEVGTFRWTGKYVAPKNENKYEVLLASADCGEPPDSNCLRRAERAKALFDKSGLSFKNSHVVMVVRPPLRSPAAYGLALGVTQATNQVQFTFNASEAKEVCNWAIAQRASGSARGLIRSDLRRYEVATRGYAPCP